MVALLSLVQVACLFVLIITTEGSIRKPRRPTLKYRVSSLESSLFDEQQKTVQLQQQIEDIEKKLDTGTTSRPVSLEPLETVCRKLVKEITGDELESIKRNLAVERQQRLELQEWADKMKDTVYNQQVTTENKFNDLHNVTHYLMEKDSNAHRHCQCVQDADMKRGNSSNITQTQPSSSDHRKRKGVRFDGIPLNEKDDRVADDCGDLSDMGYKKDGVYRILFNKTNILVRCRLRYNRRYITIGRDISRGWMVIQKRTNGTEDFNRTWEEYKHGFGDLSSEFWLGTELMWHFLNSSEVSPSVFVEVSPAGYSYSDEFIAYGDMKMASEEDGYYLDYLSYSGSKRLVYQKPGKGVFMTRDRHQREDDCPFVDGGWWYSNSEKCQFTRTNPNSKYTTQKSVETGQNIRGYIHLFGNRRGKVRDVVISGSELLVYFRNPVKVAGSR